MFDNAHRTFRFRNVQQHPAKTATKRSHGCKHRFSVEHTALVATSLRFYCLCAIISPLSEKPVQLRFFFFFSHLNQTTLLSLWLWGWILAHALHCCSFYYLCSALHWRPREHFKAPSHLISPPPEVSEKSPEHIEITYNVARIRLDLLVFCLAALLWSDGKKCFFSQCLRKKKSFIFERVIALCRRNKEPLGLFYTYFQQFLASILCPSLCLWASWERNALQR